MRRVTLLLLATTLGFAQQDKARKDPAPPPPNGPIPGAVAMAGTDTPKRDVEVAVNRGSADSVQVITDALGHYTSKDVTPGQVRVSANAPDSLGRRTGFGPNSQRQVRLA